MRLHKNPTLFRQSVKFTAQQLAIPAIYIEKDYWVMYVLHLIFTGKAGAKAVFKGGTALSKCFGIIERFSEDIDLVVLKQEGDSGNQLKKTLKEITQINSEELVEVTVDGVTNKLGMIRKVAYQYNHEFKGIFGQVRDVIIVEASWLGRHEPYGKQAVSSYIYEMMLESNQLNLAKEYGMLPFEVQVLHVNRTICEKIMSLVRFSYSSQPIADLRNKIRHIYDIHQLLQVTEVMEFLNSLYFDEMLVLVAQDDINTLKSNKDWLVHHPKEALLFKDTDKVWAELKNTYLNDFSNLVYGSLPAEDSVLGSIKLVASRLKAVKWDLERSISDKV